MLYALVVIFALVALAALLLAAKLAATARRNALEVEELSEKIVKSTQGIMQMREDVESLEHRLAEKALIHLSRQHELILETAIEGIIGIDWQGSITFVNPSASRMLERDAKELVGQSVQTFIHPPDSEDNFDHIISPIYSALADGVEHYVNNELFWRKDGKSFPVKYVCVPIKEDGEVVGAVLSFNDITERKDLEEAAASAREAALESARLKSEFLTNVSHEIRTPMNGILGMTEILLDSDLTESQRKTADTIRSSANRLLTIINDILDLSRIESGKLRFEANNFELRNLVENVFAFFAESARAKSIALDYSIDDEISNNFQSDEGRLQQVLINLIGNAIKFTKEGSVTLHITKESEKVEQTTIRFEVKDTGMGLDEIERQRLFQPFSQANNKIARRHGGTGLGLAISKQIVELMGGQIGVVSEKGKGSTFWFTINLEKCPTPEIASNKQTKKELNQFSKELPHTPSAKEKLEVVPDNKFDSLRVLVAEDNPVNQEITLYHLYKLGIKADVVADGLEVITALSRSDYDVVLMDCMMPEMDGYETTRLIREQEKDTDKRTTIVAMTANAMQGDRKKCIEAGMDDYIAKPVIFDELRSALSRCTKAKTTRPIALNDVIDRKVLDNLQTLEQNGLRHIAAEILETYLSHAPICLQNLEAGLEQHDAAAIASAAHNLRGSSSTLGMKQMTEVCASLEAKGRTNDLVGINELLSRAKKEFEKISRAIKDSREEAGK